MHPTLLRAAVLAPIVLVGACGGGESSTTSTDTTTTAAADAALISSDAATALDTGVQTAQVVVSTQAASASSGPQQTAQALPEAGSAQPAAVASVPVACPGGGSATLSISGGTAASVLNGQLDSGEVYQLTFNACRGASGAAAVDGALAMTVQAASDDQLSLSLAASSMSVALPMGAVSLSGEVSLQWATTSGAEASTLSSSHLGASSLTLQSQRNARSSSFALSDVDITRQSVWQAGVPQSSTLAGALTLGASGPSGAFSCTVSTQGSVNYSASGSPVAGSWTVGLPRTALGLSISSGSAVITVDDGKDGTIDHTLTLPLSALEAAAG